MATASTSCKEIYLRLTPILSDLFISFKIPSIRTVNTPLRARTPAVPRDEMADILNDLTKLNLGAKPILGDRTNIQEAMRKAREDAQFDSTKQIPRAGGSGGNNVIVISSDSEGGDRAPARLLPSKAYRLNQLADRASNATDNKALSQLVREFKDVLQMNSSRTLTKEAFYFLDVLYKQLDDPSVFVKPQR